jgi:TonB family protein
MKFPLFTLLSLATISLTAQNTESALIGVWVLFGEYSTDKGYHQPHPVKTVEFTTGGQAYFDYGSSNFSLPYKRQDSLLHIGTTTYSIKQLTDSSLIFIQMNGYRITKGYFRKDDKEGGKKSLEEYFSQFGEPANEAKPANITSENTTAKAEPILKVVEDNPAFPGCENLTAKSEKKKCAGEKMLQFVYGNVRYPTEARAAKIEGMVVIKFVVEKDGSITNAEIVRDIGGGCGEAALRVVNMMPAWNPGMQRGKPVRVQFNLPVKFSLQ